MPVRQPALPGTACPWGGPRTLPVTAQDGPGRRLRVLRPRRVRPQVRPRLPAAPGPRPRRQETLPRRQEPLPRQARLPAAQGPRPRLPAALLPLPVPCLWGCRSPVLPLVPFPVLRLVLILVLRTLPRFRSRWQLLLTLFRRISDCLSPLEVFRLEGNTGTAATRAAAGYFSENESIVTGSTGAPSVALSPGLRPAAAIPVTTSSPDVTLPTTV